MRATFDIDGETVLVTVWDDNRTALTTIDNLRKIVEAFAIAFSRDEAPSFDLSETRRPRK